MKSTMILICLGVLILTPGAFGQLAEASHNDVRIVSSFVAAGAPAPENCAAQAHAFAKSLVRYPRPRSWHWVLVCDETGWRHFLRLSGRAEYDSIYASTDLTTRTTYLRGAKLLLCSDFGVEIADVVTHELAHIELNGGDEPRTERLARLWQKNAESKRQTTSSENPGN